MLRKGLVAALALGGVWLFVRFALGPLFPFILALGLARLMERPVCLMAERFRLPRAVCSGLLTATFVGLLAALVAALAGVLLGQLNRLVAALPNLMAQLPDITGGWRQRVDIWIAAAPLSMQDMLRNGLDSFLAGGSSLPGEIYARAGALVTALATGFPKAALFLFATILGTFLISCEYRKLTALMMRPFSEKMRERILRIKNHLTKTAGKWLKAQGILLLLTFATLFVGLMILRQDYAFLIAGVTALLDALPVIGVAMILVPWALYCFLTGAFAKGVSLLLLYAVVALVRGLMEPRLIGRQIGLPPLLTLMSMYVGFLLWGFAGMILMPFATILVKQMVEWGWIFPGLSGRKGEDSGQEDSASTTEKL